jgi:mRNA-degrading endonuclease RelE of RelBE toxin-antitoxin system
MIFIESRLFERLRDDYLDDAQFSALQAAILQNPDAGVVTPGTRGLRKLRWGYEGSGKRGGLRIVYYVVTADARCLLLYRYPKSAQQDLAPEELRLLSKLVQVQLNTGGH